MWKSGSSPLFPVVFSPRDMVGKGEGFPHHRRSGEVSTCYSSGIHRKMWKGGGVSWLRPRPTFANSGKSRQKHRKEPPVPSLPGALYFVPDCKFIPHVHAKFLFSLRQQDCLCISAAAADANNEQRLSGYRRSCERQRRKT